MIKNWDDLKTAIQNLKKVKKSKTKNLFNLPISTLLLINGNYYIVENKERYEDWTEYKLKNILNNSKSYLEVEEDRQTLWRRADRNEELDIIEKFYKNQGDCSLIETGKTQEYKYYTIKCNGNLYSIEEYEGNSDEKEVYKAEEVKELKLL